MILLKLGLKDEYFKFIKYGKKTVEGRVAANKLKDKVYRNLSKSDKIKFINEDTNEEMIVSILAVKNYDSVRKMLKAEGLKNILPSKKTIKEGIDVYNNFTNYRKNIAKYGIYAIKIKVS